MMEIFQQKIANFVGFALTESIPQLKRGKVWCKKCGRMERVDSGRAIAGKGWPECHGETMTIDSPEERAAIIRKETP